MVLIGLSGYARVGKDTVCAVIQDLRPAYRFAFADELKKEVAQGYGATLADIEANKSHYRELLQTWGVMRRRENPNYWVAKVASKIQTPYPPPLSIITDVRFPNEVAFIREHGGWLVRVERQGVGPANGHVSESAIDDIYPDWKIRNDGTIDDLKVSVEQFLQTLPL